MGPLLAVAALQLIRGTELPREGWNATALVTIRQRLNLNAVRVEAGPGIEDLVRVANRLDLLVIVDSERPLGLSGRVMYAVATTEALAAVRAAGVTGPVMVRGFRTDDPNVIREAPSRWTDPLPPERPLLVSGLDPNLAEGGPECASFPSDPGDAAALVERRLREFDKGGVSWVISSFRPGKLITDWRYFVGTKLDDGWVCGKPMGAGLGMSLLAHMQGEDSHGLFAVNGDAGNYRLAVGGRAHAYGPVMAEKALVPGPGPLPLRLGNVSVQIKDARGVTRTAPLLYTGAGWAHITFVIPEATATGPAEIAVVRTDGTRSKTHALLGKVAPGLMSASIDGRGVAKAFVGDAPTFRCAADCEPLPIPVGASVRFIGTGFRHAKSVKVMVGEKVARVISFGPMNEPGRDQLRIEMPEGTGDADVLMWADGVLSNVVRVRIQRRGRLMPSCPAPQCP